MTTEESRETLSPPRPFEITSYWKGVYSFNGEVIGDSKLSPEIIDKWERNNQDNWGVGQALYLKDRPLTFGRVLGYVDIVISNDITTEGKILQDNTVSRKHFRVKLLDDDKVAVEDLGSTNGLTVYHDGQKAAYLKSDAEDIKTGSPGKIDILEVGDAVVIGDGSVKDESVLGFRVCKDENNQLCLVKFNLENIEVFENSLLQSLKRNQNEQLGQEITLEEALQRPELVAALEGNVYLLSFDLTQVEMRIIAKSFNRKAFEKTHTFYQDLITAIQDIGDLHLSGNFLMAARLMGEYARKLEEQKRGDATSISLPKLTSILMRIAEGKLVE